MAKGKLASMTIYPSKRGHRVVHEFERKPTYSKAPLSGGMSMGAPATEEHNFSPGEGGALMKHIGQALALKGLAQGAGGGAGGGQEEEV